jgi:hypothetical protein
MTAEWPTWWHYTPKYFCEVLLIRYKQREARCVRYPSEPCEHFIRPERCKLTTARFRFFFLFVFFVCVVAEAPPFMGRKY